MTRASLLAMVLAFSGVAFADPVQDLAWLKSADYRADFERQVDAGSFTFRGVSGLGYFVPGVSEEELRMCFAGIANSKNIEGTSDALDSEEHARLNDLAREYALRLNHLVRAYLVVSGRSHCEPGENWSDLEFQILDYLERFPDSGYGGPMDSPAGVVLGFYLPTNRVEITTEICALLARHDIRRATTLAVSAKPNLREGIASGKFERVLCEAGRIAG